MVSRKLVTRDFERVPTGTIISEELAKEAKIKPDKNGEYRASSSTRLYWVKEEYRKKKGNKVLSRRQFDQQYGRIAASGVARTQEELAALRKKEFGVQGTARGRKKSEETEKARNMHLSRKGYTVIDTSDWQAVVSMLSEKFPLNVYKVYSYGNWYRWWYDENEYSVRRDRKWGLYISETMLSDVGNNQEYIVATKEELYDIAPSTYEGFRYRAHTPSGKFRVHVYLKAKGSDMLEMKTVKDINSWKVQNEETIPKSLYTIKKQVRKKK